MSSATNDWQDFFENWPADMPRNGVLVVEFGEQIPFCSFSTKGGLLAIQRRTPDNVSARQLVVPYSQISSLKITNVIPGSVFTDAGFVGELVVS
ncbi:MAG: hypothetical protein R3C10_08505 [Pirellulales bacterium]|nr:hypothetical protein [Planctomycetales bacterium]